MRAGRDRILVGDEAGYSIEGQAGRQIEEEPGPDRCPTTLECSQAIYTKDSGLRTVRCKEKNAEKYNSDGNRTIERRQNGACKSHLK